MLCIFCVSITGCFGIQKEDHVAALVNGQKIYEKKVTNYIEGFRKQEGSYETDSSWAQYLASCGYTPESLRTYVLENLFIPQLIVHQECAKRNISVTESELNSSLDEEKYRYELMYGSDTWDSILSSYGYDEKSWANNEEQRLLEERLCNKLFPKEKPTITQIKNELKKNYSLYSGKHSYYLKFDTFDEADKFYNSLNVKESGKLEKNSEKKFKKNVKSINAGWNCIIHDRINISNEYISKLNKLNDGQVSKVFEDRNYYYVIWCDKTFTADKFTSLDDVPKRIKQEIKNNSSQDKQELKFDRWIEKIQNSSKIIINEMPENLPYDVDIALEDK